ncbi:MAG: rhamnulokinase [Ruminococcaceae bacterium]|nr:rhamnulokinase [Oscillospiraceae bacterium]
MKTVLAFDFGASTGRAIKAVFDGGSIRYEEIHRFENIPVTVDGHICHDVDMIFREIKSAIGKAGKIDSMAFDTWGVDYALLDKEGNILHAPFHYRDERTKCALDKAFAKISADEIYSETGNQIMNINTLFQLICDENIHKADKLLFMPDLFSYLLTGEKVCETTIASTSQMLNPLTKRWSEKVTDAFGISRTLFPKICQSATVNGSYKGISVVSVAGHDTQCAVAAMPCESENAAFLSCGTWSLIGCELDYPVMTAKSNALELSNEVGANGKINFLKNISGLWLIQETRRDLEKTDRKYSYNELELLARESESFRSFVDPDAPELSAHGNLPDKIRDYCRKTNQPVPETVGQVVRCIYESLALKYRLALDQISECTGKKFDVLHLMGGGTKDGFLCELASQSLGIPVIAGPVEATALGNIVLQLISLGEISSIEEGRRIIAENEKVKTFKCDHTPDWDKAFQRFCEILKK